MNQATASAATAAALPAYRYDSSAVDWRDFITAGTYYRLLDVDLENRSADMLVKFDPRSQCLYHRHAARTVTLVLAGELRVREQRSGGGEIVKVKPAGSYSCGGEDEIHIEGSGEEEAIIFFSMRTKTDVLYELLNEDLSVRKAITVADFHRDWREKWPQAAK